jgi:hypothetical protein
MATKTKKRSSPKSQKSRQPAKPTRQAAFQLVTVRYNKRRHQLTVTLSLPKWGKARKAKTKRVSVKRLPWQRKVVSYGFTAVLLVISGWGMFGLSQLLFQPSDRAVARTVPQVKAVDINAQPVGLTRSTPTKLEIPAIQLSSDIITVGQKADGTMQVPSRPDVVGWYELGPTPGEIGPTIMVGHLDSLAGPAIFWNLHKLYINLRSAMISLSRGKMAKSCAIKWTG